MIRAVATLIVLFFVFCLFFSICEIRSQLAVPPTKTETLKCVRVKEVSADVQIIYKCEVPK